MGALSGADAGQRRACLSVGDRESLLFTVRSGTQRARWASSSRSQLHRVSIRTYLATGLLRLSIGVRGSPCKNEAILTQLVSRPGACAWPAGDRLSRRARSRRDRDSPAVGDD